jgi:hypothetical protein
MDRVVTRDSEASVNWIERQRWYGIYPPNNARSLLAAVQVRPTIDDFPIRYIDEPRMFVKTYDVGGTNRHYCSNRTIDLHSRKIVLFTTSHPTLKIHDGDERSRCAEE